MADNPQAGRTFTEGEHFALVDADVKRETAARDAEIAELKSSKTELETKVDTLATEKAAAEQRATAAEEALEAYKTEQENARQIAERKESRKVELAEANPFLELTDERVDRIAALSDEDYAVYLGEMREVAEKVKATTTSNPATPVEPPAGDPAAETRATAAFKPGGDASVKKTGTVVGLYAARAGQSA